VYVDAIVSSATNAEVMTVAEERVDLLMVEEPTTTRLLDFPVSVVAMPEDVPTGASVDVATLEVIVEPAELVVVMGTVVETSEELWREDEAAELDTADADDAVLDCAALELAAELVDAVDEVPEVALLVGVLWAVVLVGELVDVGVVAELVADV
jgi:hypothetical protein